MKLRLRLVWNKKKIRDPRARALKGLVRVVEDESTKGHFKTVWLNAPKVLALAGAAGLVLWLGAAGGLYWRLQRNAHNHVQFADLACPWRWRQIPEKRGQGYLESGIEKLAQGKISDGLFDIRQGVNRHRDAAAARLAAARVYARGGYYRGVRDIMAPQLEQPSLPPREFVQFLLDAATANDDRATVINVTERLLARDGWSAEDRRWLQLKRAGALLALEQFPEALAAIGAAGEKSTLEARGLWVTALCGAGRARDAVAEVNQWGQGIPEEFRLQWLVFATRRAGQMEEMKAAIKRLQELHPATPQPWAQAIEEYSRAGWRDAARAELQEALRRFGAKPEAMSVLERTCAGVRAGDLLTLCLENAQELGGATAPILLDLAVAQLANGEQAQAERTFQRLLAVEQRARQRLAGRGLAQASAGDEANAARAQDILPDAVRDWLRTLIGALAMPSRDAAEAHCAVLENPQVPRALVALSADVFGKNERWPALAAVTRVGLRRFPGAAMLERGSTQAAERIAALPPESRVTLPEKAAVADTTSAAAISMPTPGPRLADFSSPEELLAKLDALAKSDAWAEAEVVIRTARAQKPDWLAQVSGELDWREVRGGFEQHKLLNAGAALTARLRVRPIESPRALALAREWLARGDHDTALRIAEIIVAEVPEFKPGRSFLTELKSSNGK